MQKLQVSSVVGVPSHKSEGSIIRGSDTMDIPNPKCLNPNVTVGRRLTLGFTNTRIYDTLPVGFGFY